MGNVLETVKEAKRIRHDKLDHEIVRLASVAQSELARAGVDETKAANTDDSLIKQAVVTFCLKELSDGTIRDQYERSWIIQLDQLRKSEGYRCTTR